MNKYHKQFLSSCSAENMIGLFSRYRGSHKEVTESLGMFEAANAHVGDLNDKLIVVVGDGASPRTGAIFAYYTKGEVISVDPQFNLDHWEDHVKKQTGMGYPPQRLKVIKEKIEDVPIDCGGKSVLVLWPHSHADMNNTKIFNHAGRADIAMPCCVKVPPNWAKKIHFTYDDFDILSPKRTIHIWK